MAESSDSGSGGRLIVVHERDRIETFLRRREALQIYGLGDLEPGLRELVLWYGLERGEAGEGELVALVMVFLPLAEPCLLAICGESERERAALRELLLRLHPALPPRFYAHVTEGLEAALPGAAQDRTPSLKMARRGAPEPGEAHPAAVERLPPEAWPEALELLNRASPHHWFDPRQVVGDVYGLRESGRLVAVAGTHVFAPGVGVAALAHVATDPERRGRGLARRVVTGLCRRLVERGCFMLGLNVAAHNAAAIGLYKSLGFRVVGRYVELRITHDGGHG